MSYTPTPTSVIRLESDESVIEIPSTDLFRSEMNWCFTHDGFIYILDFDAELLAPFTAGSAQVWEWYGNHTVQLIGHPEHGRYKAKGGQEFVVYATDREIWDDGLNLMDKLQKQLNAHDRLYRYDFADQASSHPPQVFTLPDLLPYSNPTRVTLVDDKFVEVGTNTTV